MDERPIGVFDSGLGGLTAVRELTELLPGEDVVYLGDTGRVPYGGRSRRIIQRYAAEDIEFLRRFDIKAVVAACGTVSTNGLEELTPRYDIPVWGVADAAAAAAAAATKNGRVGLIGTAASIRSGAYDAKLLALRGDLQLVKKACPLFVPLVEEGRVRPEDPVLRLVAEEYLAPIREFGADTLILGCTHYPLIREAIQSLLPGVTLIDPGAETARRLRTYLQERGLTAGTRRRGSVRYFVTDSVEGFVREAGRFLQRDVEGDVERAVLGEEK